MPLRLDAVGAGNTADHRSPPLPWDKNQGRILADILQMNSGTASRIADGGAQ